MEREKREFKPVGAMVFFIFIIILFALMWFSVYLVNLAEGR
jgi:hypothetical protein